MSYSTLPLYLNVKVTHNFSRFSKVTEKKSQPRITHAHESNPSLEIEMVEGTVQINEVPSSPTDGLDLLIDLWKVLQTELHYPLYLIVLWKGWMTWKRTTRDIVDKPKGKNIVDYKRIFTLKYKADGYLQTLRLDAKGYSQTYGIIIFIRTHFTPVGKMNTIQTLLPLAHILVGKFNMMLRTHFCMKT